MMLFGGELAVTVSQYAPSAGSNGSRATGVAMSGVGVAVGVPGTADAPGEPVAPGDGDAPGETAALGDAEAPGDAERAGDGDAGSSPEPPPQAASRATAGKARRASFQGILRLWRRGRERQRPG